MSVGHGVEVDASLMQEDERRRTARVARRGWASMNGGR
ncbi:hypothetical protein MYA_3717 [Burkholderia sp. KJ006]|nr:hypothetical protein MYA_3717 [Burkholderia sp. KJ006]